MRIRSNACRSTAVLVGTALVTACLFVLLTGCSLNQGDDFNVRISGRISDVESGDPIDSAWVTLYDSTLVTRFYSDVEGQFVVWWEATDSKTPLYAGKTGYITLIDTLDGVPTDTSGLVLELARMEQ